MYLRDERCLLGVVDTSVIISTLKKMVTKVNRT
jgi:hypothetical protein